MIVKVYKTAEGRQILTICDKEILGKKFEEGKLQLDLTGAFYKGEEKDESEILGLLKDADIINAVGERAIKFLEKNKIIDSRKIIRVKKIPHIQVVVP